MSKINKLFYNTFFLSGILLLLLVSCSKMNDIQSKYSNEKETIYLGKVDSIVSYPGYGKTKLVWYMNADPKVQKTIIYWNQRRDSLIKPFNRTSLGVQKDSIILENLQEGSILVEFRNVNDKGETSLMSSTTAKVWGSDFADGLKIRAVTSFDYDYNQSRYNLTLSKTGANSNVVYSEIVYVNKSNQTSVLNTPQSVSDTLIVLNDFPVGGTFKMRTVFFLPQGIDTVRNDYQTYNAPEAVSFRGTKISFTGLSTSKYFRYNDDFCEWNAAGDLIIYSVAEDGKLSEKVRYPALISRAAFREFFFYDGNRFIGVQNNNNIYMYQIVNGVLTLVRTPTGVDNFGAGFNFLKYIPARGFFYSIAENTGEIKFWFALTNATFGSPNGTVAGTGFTFVPFTLFNYKSLLGVDAMGYLWSLPVSVTGSVGSKSRMGLGWSRFVKIISVGTKLYGMESNGDFYVFNDFDATSKYWIVN